jgi:hypothetical protein
MQSIMSDLRVIKRHLMVCILDLPAIKSEMQAIKGQLMVITVGMQTIMGHLRVIKGHLMVCILDLPAIAWKSDTCRPLFRSADLPEQETPMLQGPHC